MKPLPAVRKIFILEDYRFLMNSSTETPACFKIPDNVPVLISL